MTFEKKNYFWNKVGMELDNVFMTFRPEIQLSSLKANKKTFDLDQSCPFSVTDDQIT